MGYKKSLSLMSWLLSAPIKFSIISFLLIILFIGVTSIISEAPSNMIITLSVFVALICSAVITLYKLPRENMDQQGFIALNNAQILIGTTAFLIAVLVINANQNLIFSQLMWMNIKFSVLFTIIAILVSLFFLYLCGTFVINLYAKYRRCREMGISPWKIICSMPFGFSLLWVPGYILQDQNKNNPAVSLHTNWYLKFTKWVKSSPSYTTLMFVIITIYSGLFYGFNAAILTLICTLIFAVWFRISGLSDFRQHLGRKYAYFAIILNVVIFIGLCVYITQQINTTITMNITDIETTQMIN